ncbi:MAG: CBU_0592 family membrane protein [Candidatus Limnocylindria bacterium]
MEQIFQVAGAVLILTAYIAGQLGRLDASSWPYLVLNLVGSAVLAVLAWLDADWGFLLLEGVWAIVTAWSIAIRLRGIDAAPRAHA